jgi:ABC-type dipeptide/oligopeptide/nickel transport system permease subunit
MVGVPLEVTGGEQQADTEAVLAGAPGRIEGRSLGQIAWMRLKRDKVAIVSGITILVLIALALLAPLITKALGTTPTEFNSHLIDPVLSKPKGSFGGVSLHHPLGIEPINGRDVLARILYGARISLLIAFLATLLSVTLGVLLGVLAGYKGGWSDTVISRTMDVFLAFPLLLFAIALAGVIPGEAFGLSGNGLRIAVLVFIIGFFSWPYMGRIIRGQTLSLREREFIDAAHSLGARTPYVLFRELLPNLVAPILVYSTLLIPTNILFEAALSFLGVGINPPTPSWGGMLNQAIDFYRVDPMFMIVPGFAIFLTVMAFNLLGDGLRDALDPRGR